MKSTLRNTLSGRTLLTGAVLTLALAACTSPSSKSKRAAQPAEPADSPVDPTAVYTPHWSGMQGRGLP